MVDRRTRLIVDQGRVRCARNQAVVIVQALDDRLA